MKNILIQIVLSEQNEETLDSRNRVKNIRVKGDYDTISKKIDEVSKELEKEEEVELPY